MNIKLFVVLSFLMAAESLVIFHFIIDIDDVVSIFSFVKISRGLSTLLTFSKEASFYFIDFLYLPMRKGHLIAG